MSAAQSYNPGWPVTALSLFTPSEEETWQWHQDIEQAGWHQPLLRWQVPTSRTRGRLTLRSRRERTPPVSSRFSSWKYKCRQQRNSKWIKGSFITLYMTARSWALTNKSGSKSKPTMWGRRVVVSLHSTRVQGSNPSGTSVGAMRMLCSCPDGSLHVPPTLQRGSRWSGDSRCGCHGCVPLCVGPWMSCVTTFQLLHWHVGKNI